MSNPYHAIQACIEALAAYITAQTSLAGLTVMTEWPEANQQLKFPTVSIYSQQPKFMNRQPEIISQGAIDPSTHLTTATEVVGEWDFKIELDIWTATKPDRNKWMGLISDAINSQVVDTSIVGRPSNPMGLSLQLANYFNEWVRFDVDSQQYVDDEAAAQRRERRAKISLLVNCRAIRQRVYYAMVNLETDICVGTSDADMKSKTDNSAVN